MTFAFAFCFFACRHSRTLYSGICCLSLLFSYRTTDPRTLRAAKTLGDDRGNDYGKDPLLIIRAYGKGGAYGTTLFFFIKNVTPRHKFVK